jgi:transcriptional regulator with XRE-family HTH domain
MSVTKIAQTRRPSTRGRLDDGSANPVDIHVGQRMRLRRTLLGLSQMTLAERLGLTFQQVQKYERGANRIGCSRLFDLSQVLDVPVSYFFDDMSSEVQAQSPVAVITGTAPATTEGAAVSPGHLTSRETLELVRNYYMIPPKARASVYDLAKTLARTETGEAA